MSSIFEQIQELKEQFDSLFEVDGDGLGQPAVDVPPSQNKIKKDRKTKNGKVEIVSVEDELFPYDGNKKEQYRQKIIATINDMIQGKATLEDLLQIVRQKKAPLKEAMEVLECMINEVSLGKWKQAATNSAPGRKEEAEKAKKFIEKVWNDYDKKAKEHPEDEGDLYIKAVEDGMAAHKAIQRAKHADKVQYVAPDSKHSANKYLKAANKSKDREDDEDKAIWAKHVADMDPVKSRTKRFGRAFESLEEAIQLLSELFDRPDLLDDIDTTLGSPVKKTFKKIASPKKEKKGILK